MDQVAPQWTTSKKKAWQARGQPGRIIGISEEIEGYMVYIPSSSRVLRTPNVKNVGTMDDAQNELLENQLKKEFDKE